MLTGIRSQRQDFSGNVFRFRQTSSLSPGNALLLPVTTDYADRFTITFPKGNYTVRFTGPVRENHFLASFPEPYSVTVTLPPEFDVRNYFIGSISPGAEVREGEDGSVIVTWNATKNAELRFYTEERVTMLTWFGQFWIIIAIVLLLPFLFTWKRRRE